MMKAEELVLFSTRYSSSRGAALAQAATDFNLNDILSSSISFLHDKNSVRTALDSLVVLSRINAVWTAADEEVFVKLLELYFSGHLSDKESECCVRVLANIPLQNEQLTVSQFSTFAQKFVSKVNALNFDPESFEHFVFIRVCCLGSLVSKNFRQKIAVECTSTFFRWIEQILAENPSTKTNVLCELMKNIYGAFCVDEVSKNEILVDQLQKTVNTILHLLRKEAKNQVFSEVLDKLVQCLERLPANRLKPVLELPLTKNDPMCDMPLLTVLLDDFELQIQKTSNSHMRNFEMVHLYLKVICQVIHMSRHARKEFQKRLHLTNRDYLKLPDAGNQLAPRLISLFTHPDLIVKTLSAQVFFIIAKEKVQRFIDITGYGNAAGLLYQNGFLTGNFQMDTDGDEYSSDEDDEEHERNVSRDVERSKKERKFQSPEFNPITGRVEETALKDKFANLTQEQKEREAVDLANIFSKMSNGALRPMAIDKDGKLKPVEMVAHETELSESDASESE